MCGEFRQVTDKIEVCGPISDSVRFQNVFSGLFVRLQWTKTICGCSFAPQPIRTFLKSQWRHLDFGWLGKLMANKFLFDFNPAKILHFYGKKSASVRQTKWLHRVLNYGVARISVVFWMMVLHSFLHPIHTNLLHVIDND